MHMLISINPIEKLSAAASRGAVEGVYGCA